MTATHHHHYRHHHYSPPPPPLPVRSMAVGEVFYALSLVFSRCCSARYLANLMIRSRSRRSGEHAYHRQHTTNTSNTIIINNNNNNITTTLQQQQNNNSINNNNNITTTTPTPPTPSTPTPPPPPPPEGRSQRKGQRYKRYHALNRQTTASTAKVGHTQTIKLERGGTRLHRVLMAPLDVCRAPAAGLAFAVGHARRRRHLPGMGGGRVC